MSGTLDPMSHAVGELTARVGILEQDMVQVKSYLPKIDNIEVLVTELRRDKELELEEHAKTRRAFSSRMWLVASGILLFVVQNVLQGQFVPAQYHGMINLAVGVGALVMVVFLVTKPGEAN